MFDLPFELPSGWKVKTVEQLINEDIIEKPLDGNHGGTHPKASDYVEEGVPFVMASDLVAGMVDLITCKFITEKQASKLRKGFSKSGDVLLSHKATIGRTAIVQDNEHDYIMLTPQVTYYRVKDYAKLNNVYLKAYFDSSFFQTILGLWAGAGSTRAYLGITGQLRLPVIVPPMESQHAIAHQVKTLNDKIELNRQTNQTLEQIAQAIFKSWFVDFEPTRAKIAAKQRWKAINNTTECSSPTCYAEELDSANQHARLKNQSLDDAMTQAAMAAISGKTVDELENLSPEQQQQLKATAALFPDALVESELGEVPEGWGCSEIGKEVTVVGGGTPSTKKKEYWEGGHFHWTSPKDMSNLADKILLETDRKITEVGLSKISSGLLPVDTVLMSSRAPVGYLAISKIPVAVNQGYIAMKCEGRLSPEYIVQWADSVMDDIKQRASGTTFAEISKKNFKIIPIIVPDNCLVKEYTKIVSGLYEKITEALNETKSLSETRDSLLPRLLSGNVELAASRLG